MSAAVFVFLQDMTVLQYWSDNMNYCSRLLQVTRVTLPLTLGYSEDLTETWPETRANCYLKTFVGTGGGGGVALENYNSKTWQTHVI